MDGYYHSKVNSIHFISETVMKPPVPQTWHVRRGGRPDAAMGMTSALATAGMGRREGGGGDGDGSYPTLAAGGPV